MLAPGSARTTRGTSSRSGHVRSSGAGTRTSFVSFISSLLVVQRLPEALLGKARIEAGEPLGRERVRDGVRDRGGRSDRARLPYPLCAEWIVGRRGLEERSRHGRNFGCGKELVVGERRRPRLALIVVDRLLGEALAEPLRNGSEDLPFGEEGIHDRAGNVRRGQPEDVEATRRALDLDCCSVGARGEDERRLEAR